ncbi:MAG TPA: hypothetical protein VHL11_02260 [Phototrophicaceae bacterium]|jgi:hypothetical protein|nr:hypothetical protein [Phototrophicaceae bacterium]
MGTWGMGIFENDDAGEFLDKTIQGFIDQIDYFLSPEILATDGYWGNYGQGQLLPVIDITLTLCDHYRCAFPVETSRVKHWLELTLRVLDAQIDVYYPPDKAEKREVILDIFNRLLKHAATWDN